MRTGAKSEEKFTNYRRGSQCDSVNWIGLKCDKEQVGGRGCHHDNNSSVLMEGGERPDKMWRWTAAEWRCHSNQ